MRLNVPKLLALALAPLLPLVAQGADMVRSALPSHDNEVLATGNEWIALPEIRARDGALLSFNALSMRDRGLMQANGDSGKPVLEPYFKVDGQPLPVDNPSWSVLQYWIPQAQQARDGVEITLTYVAPQGYRAAFIRLQLHNTRSTAIAATLGLRSSFGALNRITYVPVALRGERTLGPSPWVDPGEVFSYITNDTRFAWAVVHPGSKAQFIMPPVTLSPQADASQTVTLQPGASAEALFVLAVGIEEFSAAHNARALREMLDRQGADALINNLAAWCRARTRTTGQADLDLLMNRNYLFTELYAWGRTIDTEQLVGVTSRSPRYYVAAAYWDRDAMLWSFPGLLDVDPSFAAQALNYALTTQLRNTGTHSRFIDGVVLEDGFQLDEATAPLIALGSYLRTTHDKDFLRAHRDAVYLLRDRLQEHFDATTGLYWSLQDSQDEYQKLPFLTYDNTLVWRALNTLHDALADLGDTAGASQSAERAKALRNQIITRMSATPPGGNATIFASATDGHNFVFTDIPPGSLLKLPQLGLLSQDDPLFARTFDWLHSSAYKYSYADKPYGLPGSYRLPFTTSWTVADELQLHRSQEHARKILLASNWDNGIVSEGIDPGSARMDSAGGAFATAAGYVAHAICVSYCKPAP